MLMKIKLNNLKTYLIIYNKTEGNLILKSLNVLICLNFSIQTKKLQETLNIMVEAILEDNNLEDNSLVGIEVKVALEADNNKVEAVKVVRGIKMHQYL
jgi:hypothetical protein